MLLATVPAAVLVTAPAPPALALWLCVWVASVVEPEATAARLLLAAARLEERAAMAVEAVDWIEERVADSEAATEERMAVPLPPPMGTGMGKMVGWPLGRVLVSVESMEPTEESEAAMAEASVVGVCRAVAGMVS